jgi:hypothetical protein
MANGWTTEEVWFDSEPFQVEERDFDIYMSKGYFIIV